MDDIVALLPSEQVFIRSIHMDNRTSGGPFFVFLTPLCTEGDRCVRGRIVIGG